MCLGVPANERVVLFFINQFIYLMFNYLWLLFQLRVVDPQRLAHNGLSGFYDVRMRRAARLKSLVSGRSALRRDSGCKPRWSRPLSATSSTSLYCTVYHTMSKPKFQTEWEEIDEEYQQLQVRQENNWNTSLFAGACRGGWHWQPLLCSLDSTSLVRHSFSARP